MKKIIIGAIAAILVIIIGVFAWYNGSLKPVSKVAIEENELIRVEIEKGLGTNQIAKVLEKNDVIKSATAMKIFVALNDIKGLQAGVYDLNNSEDLETILTRIVNGEVASDEVKITFIEGKNIRWIAKTIAKHTNNSEADVFNLLENEEYKAFENALIEQLLELAKQGCTEFYSGMAMGFDIIAAETVLFLKEVCKKEVQAC